MRAIGPGPIDIYQAACEAISGYIGAPIGDRFAHAILKAGRALLILDGLDETGPYESSDNAARHRQQCRRAIEQFCKKREFAANQLLITCRLSAYRSRELQGTEIAVVRLSAFSRSQAHQLMANLFSQRPRHLADVGDVALVKDSIENLSLNPLMLTLHAQVASRHRERELLSRTAFYTKVVGDLLEHRPRAAGRALAFNEPEAKLQLLEAMAYRLLIDQSRETQMGDCPLELFQELAAFLWGDRISSLVDAQKLARELDHVEIILRMKQAAVAAGSALPDLAGGAFPTSDLLTWLTNLGRPNYVQQPPPIPSN